LIASSLYLCVCRLLELLVLLGRSDRAKELEILVLRHELSILRRQVGRPRFKPHDRLLFAALSRVLPRRSWNAWGAPIRSSLQIDWIRCAAEFVHPTGYRRIVGELKGLGISVSATSVRKVLLEAGLRPAPERSDSLWRAFLRAQAASMLACDFLTVETAFLQRINVLFFISLATRRIEYIASTSNPNGRWVTQQARNLVMQLGDDQPFRFLIHDRDTKFNHPFDAVFPTEGVKVIRTPIQAPNANAHAERWVRTLRSECLDRILILGRRHLEHVLRVYRHHYNEHRPHRALDLLPPNGRDPTPLDAANRPRRRDLLGGLIHEYEAA
jgi:hypothetical protein